MHEIIICTVCKGKDCRVDELYETEEITMEEYARRHPFPRDVFRQAYDYDRTARRFLITCQDCGHQHEFLERMEPLPVTWLSEGRMALKGLVGVEECFKLGYAKVPVTTETEDDQR